MSIRRRFGAAVAGLIGVVPLALASPATRAAAAVTATVPSGFTDIAVAGGLGSTTAIAAVSDGRFLVAAKTGQLELVRHDHTVATLGTVKNVCADSERGLLGVAPDPQFESNGWVYLYYTLNPGAGCVNRVSRFTIDSETLDLASEVVLLDNISSQNGNHNGGDVKVGKDGLLYVSVGDSGTGGGKARQLNSLSGKILRITRDGGIPSSNPFVGAGSARCSMTGGTAVDYCQEVVANGLRNPFRIATDQNASGTRVFMNDVGQDTSEEIDELVIGSDYGWNMREGFCDVGKSTNCSATPAGMRDPVAAYTHAETGCDAITGAAFVTNGTWGTGFNGAYLAADYTCGKIFVFTPTGSGPWTRGLFADGVGALIAMEMTADGSLYYVTMSNGGELHRIVHDAPATQSSPGAFTPLTPTRLLDTRSAVGYSLGKPGDSATLSVQVAGRFGIPSDAVAVALNVTGTESTAAGYVTVWPSGEAKPATSNLNFTRAGETVANAVLVGLGRDGSLTVFTQRSASLILDVTGFWTEASRAQAGRYQPASTPSRLLDTREGNGAPKAIVPSYGQIDLQVTGRNGIPSGGVAAVAITVTVTDSTAGGYVTVWPTGATRPVASVVNATGPNDIRSNLAIVPVGTGGKVSLFVQSATHLVVDFAGYFTDSSAPALTSGLFVAASPGRLLDTRDYPNPPYGLTDRLTANDTTLIGYGPAVTPGAVAIVHNLTVDATAAAGFLTAYPSGAGLPLASNVNWSGPSQTRASLTISSLEASSTVAYYSKVATELIIDRSGWFTG